MSEADWQQQVIQLAHHLGWRHNHTRRTIGRGRSWTTATSCVGWPDLELWHPKQRRFMWVELKSESGVVSEDQRAVLDSLAAAGGEVHVWRPSDLDVALTALQPRTVPL